MRTSIVSMVSTNGILKCSPWIDLFGLPKTLQITDMAFIDREESAP